MTDDPLRPAIEQALGFETAGWAADRVSEVMRRLARDAFDDERVDAIVIASDAPPSAAFLGAGSTIYVSRQLVEHVPVPEGLALWLAHEMAHDRLGHVPRLPAAAWWPFKLEFALSAVRWWTRWRGRERDADLVAIELVTDAGFDPDLALATFEAVAPGMEEDERGAETRIGTRVARMRRHLADVRAGTRFASAATRVRNDTLHRRLGLGGAASALVALAVLIVRRR